MFIDVKKFNLALAEKQLTKKAVIEKAGLSPVILTSINKGRKLQPLTVGRLAQALGVSVKFLTESEV